MCGSSTINLLDVQLLERGPGFGLRLVPGVGSNMISIQGSSLNIPDDLRILGPPLVPSLAMSYAVFLFVDDIWDICRYPCVDVAKPHV